MSVRRLRTRLRAHLDWLTTPPTPEEEHQANVETQHFLLVLIGCCVVCAGLAVLNG